MNRETRRLMEREERRQKKQQSESGRGAASRGALAQARASQPAGEKKSLWKRLTTFLHDVRVEMRKVSWPTREQMMAFTAVTLITSVALTLIVFGLDFGLKELVLIFVGGASG